MALARREFEALTGSLRERMIHPTMQALNDAHLTPRDIDKVVLVGGSTHMPGVQRMVRDILLHEPVIGVNPDEVVRWAPRYRGHYPGRLCRHGAARRHPAFTGIETANGELARIIERNTTSLPVRQKFLHRTG